MFYLKNIFSVPLYRHKTGWWSALQSCAMRKSVNEKITLRLLFELSSVFNCMINWQWSGQPCGPAESHAPWHAPAMVQLITENGSPFPVSLQLLNSLKKISWYMYHTLTCLVWFKYQNVYFQERTKDQHIYL